MLSREGRCILALTIRQLNSRHERTQVSGTITGKKPPFTYLKK